MSRSCMHLRITIVFALCASSFAVAQSTSAPDFRYGVNYTFERKQATRKVNDEFDQGAITLAAYVWHPVKTEKHQAVLFSHGSTGGWINHPQEPFNPVPQSILEFFIERGYTVVAALRRGTGESTGTYVEECPYHADKCTLEQNTNLYQNGIREALLDTSAVIDQVILGGAVPKRSKLILVGQSRGGLLSLVLAAERPEIVSSVVSFVGGWLSISEQWPPELNARRKQIQMDSLASAGSRLRQPTLWIYGARDSNYSEETTRGFFRAFNGAGGKGEFVYIEKHPEEDGHAVIYVPATWEGTVDRFLSEIR